MSRAGGSEFIAINSSEYMKQFYVYDGSDRVTDVYQARNNTRNGEPCLRTRYTYVGVTAVVEKMHEQQDVWSAAYDI